MKKVEKMVYIYHENRSKSAEVKFKFHGQKDIWIEVNRKIIWEIIWGINLNIKYLIFNWKKNQ